MPFGWAPPNMPSFRMIGFETVSFRRSGNWYEVQNDTRYEREIWQIESDGVGHERRAEVEVGGRS